MARFEQIYEEHRDAVRAYVRRRAPESVVEDVVSETLLVCWRKLDGIPDEPLPWCTRWRVRLSPTSVAGWRASNA